jgi:group I intron endonuclease
MAYIYKITNTINGKIYIGKTERTVEERFSEHLKDSSRRTFEKRPLYSAIRKYGKKAFVIEIIEETDFPEERETYWIEYYQSFKYGYNATLGGDGKRYLDYELIVEIFKNVGNASKTASLIGCSTDSVREVVKKYNLGEYYHWNHGNKPVNQYSLNGEYIMTYGSTFEAAKGIGKITSTSNGATSHISDVCKGKRKTAYGYIWKFAENN